MHKPQDSIIRDVLSGNAKPEDIRKVIAWFSTNEGQSYLSDYMDKEYEEKKLPQNIQPSPSVLKKILHKTRLHSSSRLPGLWLKIAAVLLPVFMIVSGLLANQYIDLFGTARIVAVHVPSGRKKTLNLPDGSRVFMGPGSNLYYPERFRLFHRDIRFSGEAYFMVEHYHFRPFNIQAGEMNVQVLGTSFNLMADTLSSDICLHLDEGQVRMKTSWGEERYIKPGESIVYDKVNREFKLTRLEDAVVYTDWKSGIIRFNDAPLEEVLNVISAKCNVNFSIENKYAKSFHYTITWENASLESMMQDMAMITPIHFVKEGNKRYIVK